MSRLLRRVYPKSKPAEDRHSIWWTFHGHDAIDRPRRWRLVYSAEKRTFSVSNASRLSDKRSLTAQLEFDAMSIRRDVKGRTLTEALRSLLTREDIALCTRKSLTKGSVL